MDVSIGLSVHPQRIRVVLAENQFAAVWMLVGIGFGPVNGPSVSQSASLAFNLALDWTLFCLVWLWLLRRCDSSHGEFLDCV